MSFHGNYNSSIMSHNTSSLLTTPTRPNFSKYSLADSWTASPPFQDRKRSYSANISTKIDSNSPGLSSRVVHYNEEREQSTPKRNCRYDKLGVFPIVHFFKKDLPVLKTKPSPMSPSELSKYNTTEHNKMLLERIIKSSPGSHSTPSYKNETNTKSVLDALKEISRKRIHANADEFMASEDGRRSHVDCDDEPTSRKRLKQNCLQMEGFVPSLSPKVSPMTELMASRSSTTGYVNQRAKKKTQRIDEKKPPEKPPAPPVICMDAETQTLKPPEPPVIESNPENSSEDDIVVEEIRQQPKPKKSPPLFVFNETPLENLRKSRCSSLVGAMTPRVPQIEKPVDAPSEASKADKPLISILSGGAKSPHKAPKHVTFEVTEVPGVCTASPTSVKTPPGAYTLTKTSAALVMPIVSASIVESPPKSLHASKIEIPIARSPISSPSQAPSSLPKANVAPVVFRSESSVSAVGATVGDGLPKTTLASAQQQPAGFKFELKEQTATEAPKAVPFSLPTLSATSLPVLGASGFNLAPNKPPELISKGFGVPSTGPFGAPKAQSMEETAVSSTTQGFPNKVAAPSFAMPTTAPISPRLLFPFDPRKINSPTTGPTNASTNLVTTASVSSSTPFSFGGPPNPPPPFSSATTFVTPNPVAFGEPPNAPKPTTSETMFFSAPNTTFGAPSATFSVPSTTFSVPSTTFSAPSTTFSAPNATFSAPSTTFSAPSTTFSAPNAAFSAPNPTFSAPNAAFSKKSVFGSGGAVPGFGGDGKKSLFGAGFGTPPATFAGGEGVPPNANPFGGAAPAQSALFGGVTSAEGSKVSFGGGTFAPPQKSSFGHDPNSVAKSGFGQAFGVANGSPFAVTTVATPFSAMKPIFSSTSGGFSANPAPAFGVTTAEAAPFGSGQFSTPVQTPQGFTFGAAGAGKPAIFSFGGPSKAPEPSFNFQAQSNAANNAIFGGAPSGAMQQQFGVQPSMGQPGGAGMFSIGSGGSPAANRFRTQHKGKRRT